MNEVRQQYFNVKEMGSSWHGQNTHFSFREPKLADRFCLICQKLVRKCPCLFLIPSFREDEEDSTILDIESQTGTNVDLDLLSPNCPKSHQHNQFIPVTDFTLQDLPADIRHPSFYVWLKYCFPLVVRMTRNSYASGRITTMPANKNKSLKCRDRDCPHSEVLGLTHEVYGGLGIITNQHVVERNEDAVNTSVQFFYNSDKDYVIAEFCDKIYSTNRTFDYSLISCYVHSTDLVDMIELLITIKTHLWNSIPKRVRENSRKYAIIISHPHGASKQISIGEKVLSETYGLNEETKENLKLYLKLLDICEKNNAEKRLSVYITLLSDIRLPCRRTFYTTATCSGSSGAPVYMGNVEKDANGNQTNQAHTHRGVDKLKGYNNCFT